MAKRIPPKLYDAIEEEVRDLLVEARASMKRRGTYDMSVVTFDVNNPYYAEAFGVFRGLALAGFGTIDRERDIDVPASDGRPITTFTSFRQWFNRLQKEVLSQDMDYNIKKTVLFDSNDMNLL
jgi:hypothetical protein